MKEQSGELRSRMRAAIGWGASVMLVGAVIAAYGFLHAGPVFFLVGIAGLVTILISLFLVTFWCTVTAIEI